MKDYYAIFGVPRYTDSKDLIKKAYREQIHFFHPDNGNVSPEIAEEKTKELNQGYNILRDDERREEYDEELADFLAEGEQTEEDRLKAGYEYFRSIQPRNEYSGGKKVSTPGSTDKDKRFLKTVAICAGILLVIVVIVNSSSTGSTGTKNTSAPVTTQAAQTTTVQEVTTAHGETETKSPDAGLQQQIVVNGKIFKTPLGEKPCSFTVKTTSGSNYYVYLKDRKGSDDISFYVEGGKTVTVDVPLGSYKLYYCSGDTWYGTQHKFGSKTAASTSDDIFTFSSTVSGNYIYYDTWEVTLYKVSGGNMETEHIDMDEFPG